jgi:hypothetical protein
MKTIRSILTIVFILVLSACGNAAIEENATKLEIAQQINVFISGVNAYCITGCDEGEEITYDDMFSFIEVSFPTELFVMESDTVIAKYTSEGTYIYLVPAGDNIYGYEGLIPSGELFNKDDLMEYQD